MCLLPWIWTMLRLATWDALKPNSKSVPSRKRRCAFHRLFPYLSLSNEQSVTYLYVKKLGMILLCADLLFFSKGDWLACHEIFLNYLLMPNTRSNLITRHNCSVTFPRTQLCFSDLRLCQRHPWVESDAPSQIIAALLMFDEQQGFYMKKKTPQHSPRTD